MGDRDRDREEGKRINRSRDESHTTEGESCGFVGWAY